MPTVEATELHLEQFHPTSHSHHPNMTSSAHSNEFGVTMSNDINSTSNITSSSTSTAPFTHSPTSPTSAAIRWSSSEMGLSHHHRIMSAAIGALLTSLVVTPFDVVKTRLQAQINSIQRMEQHSHSHSHSHHAHTYGVRGSNSSSCTVPIRRPTASQLLLQDCAHYRLHTGLMDSWCNNCFSKAAPSPPPSLTFKAPPELHFTGAVDAATKLIKHEGIFSLWRGLSPTILMSIPSTVVYFSMYDKVKLALVHLTPDRLNHFSSGLGQYSNQIITFSPLLAGVFARALTTTLVSPIELVRTKSQSLRTSASMRSLLLSEWKTGGFLSLWRGVGPTLMRDVPFSAVYWSCYEFSKRHLLDHWATKGHIGNGAWVQASFIAGAGSGMLAAAVTHPFDLIKTRRQIDLYKQDAIRLQRHIPVGAFNSLPSSTWTVCKTIIQEEGYVGLLSGLSARITKIAPACAIMISTYEASKLLFGEQNRSPN